MRLHRIGSVALLLLAPGARAEPPLPPADPEPVPAVTLTVHNTASVPISVTSHFHFFESNPRLDFDRAAAYGIPGVRISGDDFFAVHAAVTEAAERARSGGGPTLIEAEVLRLQSHSTDDDQRAYRDPAELAAEALKDPIPRMRDALIARGWLSPQADQAMRDDVNREVEKATEACKAAPNPPMDILFTDVYADGGWAWRN